MADILQMPPRTYVARLFEVPVGSSSFKVAGTLDGFIDFATDNGTYPLSVEECRALLAALENSIRDIEINCLHDNDALLEN